MKEQRDAGPEEPSGGGAGMSWAQAYRETPPSASAASSGGTQNPQL